MNYTTVENAAKVLGISESAIRRRVSSGKLRGAKVGNTIIIDQDEIDKHIKENLSKINAPISASEAATILNCSPQHVGRLLKDGRLNGVQVRRKWHVERRDVDRFNEMRKIQMSLPEIADEQTATFTKDHIDAAYQRGVKDGKDQAESDLEHLFQRGQRQGYSDALAFCARLIARQSEKYDPE
jgi:excisionase family DNA binding protein